MIMAESWYKEYCPKCDTVNWVCNGDESDLSGVDIDGYQCRKCGHIESLGEEIVEPSNWELGLENPN